VIEAIQNTLTGSIAVTYVEWAANQATVVDWTIINSPETAEAFAAAQARPVVTVMPQMRMTDAGRVLRIPAEADYGGEEFLAGDPPSM
jgi:hypothetical protein